MILVLSTKLLYFILLLFILYLENMMLVNIFLGVERWGNPPLQPALKEIAGQDEEYVFIAGNYATLVMDIAIVYHRICESWYQS